MAAESSDSPTVSLDATLAAVGSHVEAVWSRLPPDSALVVFSANNCMHTVARLLKERFHARKAGSWTDDRQSELWREVAHAKAGCALFALKKAPAAAAAAAAGADA